MSKALARWILLALAGLFILLGVYHFRLKKELGLTKLPDRP